MTPRYVVAASLMSLLGAAILGPGLLLCAFLSLLVGLTDLELGLERIIGPWPFVIVGVAGILISIWAVIAAVNAWRGRDRIVEVHEGAIELQTPLRRRQMSVSDIGDITVETQHNHSRLVLTSRKGERLQSMLRPDSGDWDAVRFDLDELLHAGTSEGG